MSPQTVSTIFPPSVRAKLIAASKVDASASAGMSLIRIGAVNKAESYARHVCPELFKTEEVVK